MPLFLAIAASNVEENVFSARMVFGKADPAEAAADLVVAEATLLLDVYPCNTLDILLSRVLNILMHSKMPSGVPDTGSIFFVISVAISSAAESLTLENIFKTSAYMATGVIHGAFEIPVSSAASPSAEEIKPLKSSCTPEVALVSELSGRSLYTSRAADASLP